MTNQVELEGDEVITRKSSPELFLAAVTTVPMPPEFAELCFHAEGLEAPNSTNPEDIEKYRQVCLNRRIVPHSTVKFRYDPGTELFLPDRMDGFIFSTSIPKNLESSTASFIQGGRISKLGFEIGHRYGKEEFTSFKEKYLNQLLESGYRLTGGFLALTTYRLTGYNEGTYPDTDLAFGNIHDGMRLKFGSKIDRHDVNKLREWFVKLVTLK